MILMNLDKMIDEEKPVRAIYKCRGTELLKTLVEERMGLSLRSR